MSNIITEKPEKVTPSIKTKVKKKKRSSNYGGARPNSGRKPLLGKEDLAYVKALVAEHGSRPDETEKDKKERILHLLDTLYREGKKGNIAAIKEYLDRQLGKAQNNLDITSKGDRINLTALFNEATKEESEGDGLEKIKGF